MHLSGHAIKVGGAEEGGEGQCAGQGDMVRVAGSQTEERATGRNRWLPPNTAFRFRPGVQRSNSGAAQPRRPRGNGKDRRSAWKTVPIPVISGYFAVLTIEAGQAALRMAEPRRKALIMLFPLQGRDEDFRTLRAPHSPAAGAGRDDSRLLPGWPELPAAPDDHAPGLDRGWGAYCACRRHRLPPLVVAVSRPDA